MGPHIRSMWLFLGSYLSITGDHVRRCATWVVQPLQYSRELLYTEHHLAESSDRGMVYLLFCCEWD